MYPDEEQKLIEDRIEKRYDTLVLSRKQVSEILNKSTSTIDRWRSQRIKLKYSKIGSSKNSTIEYSISEIAKYIINNQIKVR